MDQKISDLIKGLTKEQKEELLSHLQTNFNSIDTFMSVRNEIVKEKITCPYCGTDKVYKRGMVNGNQKFSCRNQECKRIFSSVTGTSISYIKKKEKLNQFVKLTLDGLTIREIGSKLGLSKQTIFDWRHKLLISIQEIFKKNFFGIVEMDEMFYRFNQKGQRNGKRIPIQRSTRGDTNNKVKVMVSFTIFSPDIYDRPACFEIQLLSLSQQLYNAYAVGVYEKDWYAGWKNVMHASNSSGQETWKGRRKFENEWYYFDPASNDKYDFNTRNPTRHSTYYNYTKGEVRLHRWD